MADDLFSGTYHPDGAVGKLSDWGDATSKDQVTKILSALQQGDRRAGGELLPLVYDELRKLAALRLDAERPGQTLQATALVHDSYLRLVDAEQAQRWDSRGHFFAAAAEAMRRILIDNARRKARPKHGGQLKRINFDDVAAVTEPAAPPDDLLALREWLTGQKIEPVIPYKDNQAERHAPTVWFDRIAYRGRCVAEQCVGWLKEFRRIGTRFEKLAVHFHGMLQLAMIGRYLKLLCSDRA